MYYYNQLQKWTNTRKKVEAETEWDTGRIDNAIGYLHNLELIDVIEHNNKFKGLGAHNNSKTPIKGNIRETIISLTEKGISTVENTQTFNSTFGFEIGVPGLFKFSLRVQNLYGNYLESIRC